MASKKLTKWQARWCNAPGVRTGFFSWASRNGDDVAHCHRTKVRVEQGLCGFSFGGKVHIPGAEARMCERCVAKATEMEQMLARARPGHREDIVRIVVPS